MFDRLIAAFYFNRANMKARLVHRRGGSTADIRQILHYADRAVQANHSSSDYFRLRGAVHLLLGHIDMALSDLNAALDRNPANAEAYLNRGDCYFQLGDLAEAIADYSRALQDESIRRSAYRGRAQARYYCSDWDGAYNDSQRSLSIRPDLFAYAISSWVASKKGNHARALEYCRSMVMELKANARIADILLVREAQARALAAQDDREEALKICAGMLALAREDPFLLASVHSHRGRIYQESRDWDSAIADFSEAIRLDPRRFIPTFYSYLYRGDCYCARKEYGNAVDDYTQAIEIRPYYLQAYQGRSRAYDAMGDLESAKLDAKEADFQQARQKAIIQGIWETEQGG